MLFWITVGIFTAVAYGLGRTLTRCEGDVRAYDAGYADGLAYARRGVEDIAHYLDHPSNGGERES